MNAKYYQKDQKNKSVGIVRVAAVVLILLSAGLLYQMYVETHFQIYDSALRFHVRAASDAPEDQRRKLLVREPMLLLALDTGAAEPSSVGRPFWARASYSSLTSLPAMTWNWS